MHFTITGGMVGKYDHIYTHIYRERERDRTWEASMHAYMPCQTHDIIFLSIETHSYFPLKST